MNNQTTFSGNLTREPEIRYTQDGQACALITVAINHRWQNREQKEADVWEESTSYIDVVSWRELAENVALSLGRGARVMVSGRLEQRHWETEHGERRSKVEVVADDIGASLRYATADVAKNERRSAHSDVAPFPTETLPGAE
jgi:single-strand DNA-binding protein